MGKKKTSSSKHQLAASPEAKTPEPVAAPVVSPPRGSEPRNHQELAQAILARCDPVQVGCELLSSGSEKGASVRARFFETIVNWQFGKTGTSSSADRAGVRIIWDLPGPARESEDSE